ncbi:Exodeoxyribonuclease V, alpha subunit (RecD) [Mycobacteroides abscessus subsp. abscessus]|nr:AAA family ATPase [Mycobacteroides abscessus]SIK12624.1 Exodeoxyribonuclease V, alpha subunit (RecD) [Mycobacteroides abscessus subsp. abscessus]
MSLVEAFGEILEPADVHVAQRLTALASETDESVELAIALAVRALRGGSVCVDLRAVAAQVDMPSLPWPAADDWLAAVRASPLAGEPPVLRLFGDLLYLDRYWREEQQVCTDVQALMAAAQPRTEVPTYERLFPQGFEEQQAAADIALSQGLTVLTGGPGTGKTTTVARLLALLAEQATAADSPPLRIALAAPTGKAAARLQEAVRLEVNKLDAVDRSRLAGLQATTLHRLLGSRPDTSSRGQSLRGYLSGSVDAVLRVGARYVVVDYKTNWLGTGDTPLTAADYSRPRMVEAMLHSDYPLQALLYSVVLHRFLSWRLPGYRPEEHLGGAVYLFVRGMCGAATPVENGHPAGVFSWQPPSALVVALSELLS